MINAVFVRKDTNQVTLNVTKVGNGKVTSAPAGIHCGTTCLAEYNYSGENFDVTLTAEPELGEFFTGWSGYPCADPKDPICTVTMNRNIQITATFSKSPGKPGYSTLDVRKTGEGSISSTPTGIFCGSTCSTEFENGKTVTLTAFPATGYRLVWGEHADACASSGPDYCIVSMTSNKRVSVNFVRNACESRPFNPSEERIMDMYVAYYGRAPYAEGLDWWVNQLNAAGGNMRAIVDAFGSGDEYRRRSQNMKGAALVNRLYEYILGRKADAPGLAHYTGELDSEKETLGTIAIKLLDGVPQTGKDRNLLENRKTVARHFASKTERIRGQRPQPLSDVKLAEIMDKVTENHDSANAACNTLSAAIR